MNYQEAKELSRQYKQQYVAGLEAVIEEREQHCESVRREYAKHIFQNPEGYRDELRKMLGWPLVDYQTNGVVIPKTEKLSEEDGYSVYRMQFEILKGLTLTGLFFKADGGKKPLVIVQHGGAGTPEFVAGMYGSSEYYYDVIQNLIKEGAHVFAPQLLLWDDTYSVDYDRKAIDARLKRVGSSITAVEIHGIIEILNYFEQEDSVASFGMVGLSYGGFYTLYTAALDTRIKAAVSCAFLNERKRYAYSDWTWFQSAKRMDDEEIACLIYPRKLWIELGNRDDLFDIKSGLSAYGKLEKLCETVGHEWLKLVVFDGIHEFCQDTEPLKQLVNRLQTQNS